jgi:nucleoside-diphosphate-sugar epimerase
VLRLPLVYGAGGSSVLTAMMAEQAKKSGAVEYIDAGDTLLSVLHRDDMGTAYQRSLEVLATSTALNIASGRTISNRRLAELTANSLGADVKAKSIPYAVAIKERIWANMLASNLVMNADRARKSLGWKPVGTAIEDEFNIASSH